MARELEKRTNQMWDSGTKVRTVAGARHELRGKWAEKLARAKMASEGVQPFR